MIGLLIWLLVLGLVIGLVWWVMDYLPVPEPFNKIIKVVALVVFVVIIISMLLNIGGVNVPKLG